MKTINLVIICITILLVVGVVTYGIVINEIYETPYEQCLKTCQYSDKIHCAEVCTEGISEALNELIKNVSPMVETFLEGERR